MPTLVLVNGPPGAGKSTVAARWAERRPMALVVEIDDLRTRLGCWASIDETKLAARRLADALIEAHLTDGHDVVVPQFNGQVGLVDHLDSLSARTGARFVHVILDVVPSVAAGRFRERRRELETAGVGHPSADVADGAIDDIVAGAVDALRRVAQARPATHVLAGPVDAVVASLDGLVAGRAG